MFAIQHFLRHARLAVGLWVLGSPQGIAGFSSIYVFGDGVSNTNQLPAGEAPYHGTRYCNGRVWVEVLSEWQGVTFNGANNISFFGQDSAELKTSVQAFAAPADAGSSLFIVWSNDADFVDAIGADITLPFGSLTPWTQLAADSIADQLTALATLYNKGAREIVLPLAVDVMSIPFYNNVGQADRAFARSRIIEYNNQFKAAMHGFVASKQGLKIHLPDTFAFFEQVLANPAVYGMINPSREDGNAGGLDSGDPALNGAGAQYVFWDDFHPTAKFQMHLAAFMQQIISPVKVNSISLNGGNVQMHLANIPLGRAGVVLGSPNLQAPWIQDAEIGTSNPVIFPASGSKRFYRAAFPVVWNWP